MLITDYDISKIKPASYNPRYLSIDKKEKLLYSIKEVGFLKPIIINSNNTIIAGHQRTKCLLEIGETKVKAFVVDGITKTDEVRFNQMHNGSDIEIGKGDTVRINTDKKGWHYVKPSQIEILKLGNNANQKKELSRLALRYGEFGSCVIDNNNNCIISSDYASVAKMLNFDLYVYKEVNEKQVEKIKKVFSLSYGEFNYDLLEKQTYVQCLAQMNRLEGEKQLKSTLYEKFVIPNINKKERVLDFGAGKMGYVKRLKSLGYNIKGLEFFLRKKGSNIIDYDKVNNTIDEIISDITKNGLFDVVICDSVLNSVDSMDCHNAVLGTIRSLCKNNGKLFFSGRNYEFVERIGSAKKTTDKSNYIYFYDKNLFTANFRAGNWYYQKFHTKEMVKDICDAIGDKNKISTKGSSFQCYCINENILSVEEKKKAIEVEFDLPLPNGKRYNKHIDVIKVLGL